MEKIISDLNGFITSSTFHETTIEGKQKEIIEFDEKVEELSKLVDQLKELSSKEKNNLNEQIDEYNKKLECEFSEFENQKKQEIENKRNEIKNKMMKPFTITQVKEEPQEIKQELPQLPQPTQSSQPLQTILSFSDVFENDPEEQQIRAISKSLRQLETTHDQLTDFQDFFPVLENWCGKSNMELLFDSKTQDFDIFYDKVFNHRNMYLLTFFDNSIVGYYFNLEVKEFEKIILDDKHFIFRYTHNLKKYQLQPQLKAGLLIHDKSIADFSICEIGNLGMGVWTSISQLNTSNSYFTQLKDLYQSIDEQLFLPNRKFKTNRIVLLQAY